MEVEIVKKLLTVACGREASKMVEYYSFDSAFDPFENTFIAWIAHEVLHKRSQKLWKTTFTCCKLRTLFRKLIKILPNWTLKKRSGDWKQHCNDSLQLRMSHFNHFILNFHSNYVRMHYKAFPRYEQLVWNLILIKLHVL